MGRSFEAGLEEIMSDRTSAEIFGEIFKLMAKLEEKDPRLSLGEEAKYFWNKARDYDFNDYQMCCDKALIALGLAKMGTHPDYPDDGEIVLYDRNGEWEG
jgi:hypothetical protein